MTCLLCGETTETSRILDHIRLLHPDVDAEPERWPDGTPIAYENPELFAET